MKNNRMQKGFTIVELLIVIVVIAILAAITIVGYNGIKERADVTAVKSDLSANRKKLLAYHAINGTYPQSQDVRNNNASTCTNSGLTAGLTSANGQYYCPILSNGASSDYNNVTLATNGGQNFRLDIGKGKYAYSIDQSGTITRIDDCTKTSGNEAAAANYGYSDVYGCSSSIAYSQ